MGTFASMGGQALKVPFSRVSKGTASLVAVFVPRREPFRGPMLTAAEYNQRVREDENLKPFEERLPQSMIPSRASKSNVVFFLSPMGSSFSNDFLASGEKHVVPFKPGIVPGRLSVPPNRRNIDRPVSVPYGNTVPSMDGVSPYGLD